MKRNGISTVVLLAVTIAMLPRDARAYHQATHKIFNKYVGDNNIGGFSLDKRLKDALDLPGGVTTSAMGKALDEWLGIGGEEEDRPDISFHYPFLFNPRAWNHYHDPIANKGLRYLHDEWRSSIQWGLLPARSQKLNGNYSYHDVLDYYDKALTSESPSEREDYLASTFRGLGQLIHLIEDASVPAHTRNQPHGYYRQYEDWARDTIGTVGELTSLYGAAIVNAPSCTGHIWNLGSFIDAGVYNGTNPARTVDSDAGIAEFANANFLATRFLNKDLESDIGDLSPDSNSYPYPELSSTSLDPAVPRVVYAEDGIPDLAPYLAKTRDGVSVERFAKPGYLHRYFDDPEIHPTPEEWRLTLMLDDAVYANYGQILIPRAIKYAAGFLKHFFRADLDLVPAAGGADKFEITNLSDEWMNGIFRVFYDDAFDTRHEVNIPELQGCDPPDPSCLFALSIAAGGKSSPLTIKEPNSSDPDAPKERGRYILVFEGQMGEVGDDVGETTVVGKVVKRTCAWCETWQGVSFESGVLGGADLGPWPCPWWGCPPPPQPHQYVQGYTQTVRADHEWSLQYSASEVSVVPFDFHYVVSPGVATSQPGVPEGQILTWHVSGGMGPGFMTRFQIQMGTLPWVNWPPPFAGIHVSVAKGMWLRQTVQVEGDLYGGLSYYASGVKEGSVAWFAGGSPYTFRLGQRTALDFDLYGQVRDTVDDLNRWSAPYGGIQWAPEDLAVEWIMLQLGGAYGTQTQHPFEGTAYIGDLSITVEEGGQQ